MFCRNAQDLLHVRAFCVYQSNGIFAIRQGDNALGAEFPAAELNDHLGLTGKSVNVARGMIVRINDKPDSAES